MRRESPKYLKKSALMLIFVFAFSLVNNGLGSIFIQKFFGHGHQSEIVHEQGSVHLKLIHYEFGFSEGALLQNSSSHHDYFYLNQGIQTLRKTKLELPELSLGVLVYILPLLQISKVNFSGVSSFVEQKTPLVMAMLCSTVIIV